MWARIDGNRIVEITEIDPDGRFHPSIQWVSCSPEVEAGWLWDGSTFTPAEPHQPAADEVIAERARRLALGFDFDFDDARSTHRIGTTRQDMSGWDEVTRWAQTQIALGKSDTLAIVTDTGPTQVTALEWYQIIETASEAHQPIWQASFMLQAMDPIPENYTDDQWWP